MRNDSTLPAGLLRGSSKVCCCDAKEIDHFPDAPPRSANHCDSDSGRNRSGRLGGSGRCPRDQISKRVGRVWASGTAALERRRPGGVPYRGQSLPTFRANWSTLGQPLKRRCLLAAARGRGIATCESGAGLPATVAAGTSGIRGPTLTAMTCDGWATPRVPTASTGIDPIAIHSWPMRGSRTCVLSKRVAATTCLPRAQATLPTR